MIRTTNPYTNHMRSLRPYLEQAPSSLRDLVVLAQAMKFDTDRGWEPASSESGNTHQLDDLDALLRAASLLAGLGEPETAKRLLLAVLEMAKQARNAEVISETMIAVARSLNQLGETRTAEQTLTGAIRLAQESGNGPTAQKAQLELENLASRRPTTV